MDIGGGVHERSWIDEKRLRLLAKIKQLIKECDSVGNDPRAKALKEALKRTHDNMQYCRSPKELTLYADFIKEAGILVKRVQYAVNNDFSVREIKEGAGEGILERDGVAYITMRSPVQKEVFLQITLDAEIYRGLAEELKTGSPGKNTFVFAELVSCDELSRRHNLVGASVEFVASQHKVREEEAAAAGQLTVSLENNTESVLGDVLGIMEAVRSGKLKVSDSAERSWERAVTKEFGDSSKAYADIKKRIIESGFSKEQKALLAELLEWGSQEHDVFGSAKYWALGILDEFLDASKGREKGELDSGRFFVLAYKLQASLYTHYEGTKWIRFSTSVALLEQEQFVSANNLNYASAGIGFGEDTKDGRNKWNAKTETQLGSGYSVTGVFSVSLRSLVFTAPLFQVNGGLDFTSNGKELLENGLSISYGGIGFGFYGGKPQLYCGSMRINLVNGKANLTMPLPIFIALQAVGTAQRLPELIANADTSALVAGAVAYDTLEAFVPITTVRNIISILDLLIPDLTRKERVSVAEFRSVTQMLDLLLKSDNYNIALNYIAELLDAKSLNPLMKAQLKAFRDDAVALELVHLEPGESVVPSKVIRKSVSESFEALKRMLAYMKQNPEKLTQLDAELFLMHYAYLTQKMVILGGNGKITYDSEICAESAQEYAELACLLMEATEFVSHEKLVDKYKKMLDERGNREELDAFTYFMLFLDNATNAVESNAALKMEYARYLVKKDKIEEGYAGDLRMAARFLSFQYGNLRATLAKEFADAQKQVKILDPELKLAMAADGSISSPEGQALLDYIKSGRAAAALNSSQYFTFINAAYAILWAQSTEEYWKEKELQATLEKLWSEYQKNGDEYEIHRLCDRLVWLYGEFHGMDKVKAFAAAIEQKKQFHETEALFLGITDLVKDRVRFYNRVDELQESLNNAMKNNPDHVLDNLKYRQRIAQQEVKLYPRLAKIPEESQGAVKSAQEYVAEAGELLAESGADQLLGYEIDWANGKNLVDSTKELWEAMQEDASERTMKRLKALARKYVKSGPGAEELEALIHAYENNADQTQLGELYKALERKVFTRAEASVYNAMEQVPQAPPELRNLMAFGFSSLNYGQEDLLENVLRISILNARIKKIEDSKSGDPIIRAHYELLVKERSRLLKTLYGKMSPRKGAPGKSLFGYDDYDLRRRARKYEKVLETHLEATQAGSQEKSEATQILRGHTCATKLRVNLLDAEERTVAPVLVALQKNMSEMSEIAYALRQKAGELEYLVKQLEGMASMEPDKKKRDQYLKAADKLRDAAKKLGKAAEKIEKYVSDAKKTVDKYGEYVQGKKKYAAFEDHLFRMELKGYTRPVKREEYPQF